MQLFFKLVSVSPCSMSKLNIIFKPVQCMDCVKSENGWNRRQTFPLYTMCLYGADVW